MARSKSVLALDKEDAEDVQKEKYFKDCPGIVREHTEVWTEKCHFDRGKDMLAFTIPPERKR